jgi:cyclic pyranopterin monophosphate synthase
MTDITNKTFTLRQAVALAVVQVSSEETVKAVREKRVPKGDVFEFSRAAALLAIKKTSDVIPDCHPLPIEYAALTYEIDGLNINIRAEVHTIYKTGVEVEAMHGAMIAALTMYDMLKPIDKGLEIKSVVLESKKGGKSSFPASGEKGLQCAVVVCSDRVSAGEQEDVSGKLLVELLKGKGMDVEEYSVVPDEITAIQSKAKEYHTKSYDLVLFTGGTGLSVRDVTPEAIRPLIEQDIPGVMEAARNYGQQRTPLAMLSRGVAGFMGDTLLITFPGSPKGVKETMDALFPGILHVFSIRKGKGH